MVRPYGGLGVQTCRQDVGNRRFSAMMGCVAFRLSPGSAFHNAGVAELADAPDLGSGTARCEGSSPFARTSFHIPRVLVPAELFSVLACVGRAIILPIASSSSSRSFPADYLHFIFLQSALYFLVDRFLQAVIDPLPLLVPACRALSCAFRSYCAFLPACQGVFAPQIQLCLRFGNQTPVMDELSRTRTRRYNTMSN